MQYPLESLLAEKDRGSAPCSAKVHIAKGSELSVFSLLKERGIISWLRDDQVFSDSRGKYLSGMFGVSKPGKFTENNLPVLRVIMNLIPVNALFGVLRGDIDCLPNATCWIPLVLSEGDEITMSQGDMSSAFYLFEIPTAWQPFMCFNFVFKGEELPSEGLEKGVMYRPSCRVLPMGWSSSVAIMQAISREVLLSRGLPVDLEIRKNKPLPRWFTQVIESSSPTRAWWQVYLDNFLACEVGKFSTSKDVELQTKAMNSWESAGILTALDKQVLGSKEATELGVRIDGMRGLLGGSPSRFLKTIWSSLSLFLKGSWTKKEVQIILGRWVFLLQYRRAAMVFFYLSHGSPLKFLGLARLRGQ